MSMSQFVLLCIMNAVLLTGVLCGLIYFLIKRDAKMKEETAHVIAKEKKRLEQLLDEIANVTMVLHSDIEEKEKVVKRLLFDTEKSIRTLAEHLRDYEGRLQELSQVKEEALHRAEHESRGELKDERSEDTQRIYALANQGYSVVEIARMVGKQKGEIELILHLQKVLKESNVSASS